MSLNPSTPASIISTAYIGKVTTPPYTSGDIGIAWGEAFLSWSTAGVLDQAGGVAGSEDSSIIQSFISGLTGNSNPTTFANILANYWNTCLLTPNGNAVGVSNDALSNISSFYSAITNSMTTSERTPYFRHLFVNLQNIALPDVTWTVNRIVGGSSVTTYEKVS